MRLDDGKMTSKKMSKRSTSQAWMPKTQGGPWTRARRTSKQSNSESATRRNSTSWSRVSASTTRNQRSASQLCGAWLVAQSLSAKPQAPREGVIEQDGLLVL
eukprot:273353-Amphidinium_carterae.1